MTTPITRQEALGNVLLHMVGKINSWNTDKLPCYEEKPSNCHIYGMPKEPCWFIYVPWGDECGGTTMLRSSRVILVSKQTGKVLYDGSAGNEG